MADMDDFAGLAIEDGEAMSSAMSESEIAAILRTEIEDAVGYDNSEYEQDRKDAIDYYHGTMADTPAEEGRSKVVSYDVADTIGEIMPQLMRVFFSGDKVVDYEPEKPGDEAFAAQATDYVNHILIKKCGIYDVMWDGFHNALHLRNGVFHYYWDATPKFTTHRLSGLTQEGIAQLDQDEEVEILEASERAPMMTGDVGPDGQPVMMPAYDVKIRRVQERGRIKVCALPPEEFLINAEATSMTDARFACWRQLVSRSSLKERGYDPEKIDSLPTYNDLEFSETAQARFETGHVFGATQGLDESQQEVQIYDCYVRLDVNKDGVGEWMHIVLGGNASDDNILLIEEWDDEVPFTDITPERVPHRWQGRSIYDETHDIQRIKTVVLRATLDSCYLSNNPDEFVNEQAIVDPDELLSRQIGRRIRVKGDPSGAVFAHQLPFIGQHTFPMMDYLDSIITKRTGISQASAALDPEALQNQTATAANLAASAQYGKVELIARNFAEQMRRMFRAILRLVVENQDRAVMMRLRGEFVPMDPRSWNADMDCTVNIGLGTGSRDRDMAMLQVIAMEQDKFLDNLGPNNPVVSLQQRRNTAAKIAEAGGLKNAEFYFSEVTDEAMQQFTQQQAEAAQQIPPQDQAKMQLEQMKAGQQAQAEEQKAQAAERKEMAQMQADLMTKRADLEKETLQRRQDMEMKMVEAQRTEQLERERMTLDATFKQQDLQLKQQDLMLKYGAETLPEGGLAFGGTQIMQGVVEALGALQGQIEAMRQEGARPRRIVRDEKGRVAGVE